MTTTRIWILAGLLAISGCQRGKTTESKPPAGDDAGAKPVAPAGTEYWSGKLSGPNGVAVELAVTLVREDEGYRGTVAIPAQGLEDLALKDLVREGDKLSFTIAPPGVPEPAWGLVSVTVAADGKSAEGTMTVSATPLPIAFERVATADELPRRWSRPQTPKPPFPYQARDVEYQNPLEHCTLAGTMTYPSGTGRHPAVVLISGSGAQDRDETIFGHKPFLVLADYLTRRGLVVLRVDDRGVGKTTCDPKTATVQVHGTDVEAGVGFLAKQPEVDPTRIGLLGHSEGGMIAPLVAARWTQPPIAFVIALAGLGVSGGELIPLQARPILEAQGVSAKGIEALVAEQDKIMSAIQHDADDDTVVKLVRASLDVAAEYIPAAAAITKEQRDAQVAAQAASLTSPWFRSFVKFDPRKVWPEVKCPVLALFGTKDTQVPADANLHALSEAVAKGGNRDVEIEKLEGLNHLFQAAKTGLIEEYAKIDETIDPAALTAIDKWLVGHGLASAKPAK